MNTWKIEMEVSDFADDYRNQKIVIREATEYILQLVEALDSCKTVNVTKLEKIK